MLQVAINFDIELFRWINNLSGVAWLDKLMMLISATDFWFAVFIAAIIVAMRTKRWGYLSAVVFALICLGLADLISFEVIKQSVMRERPCWILENVKMVLGRCGGSYGFTSNHAANAGAVVAALWLSQSVSKKILHASLVAAFLVGFSRIYLGVHYPADIIGGFLVGAGTAFILAKIRLNIFVSGIVDRLSKSIM